MRVPGSTLHTRAACLPCPAGLSLRTQELTAAFLAVRLFCSFMMEYDIHTLLDLLTLLATGWVIFSLRGPLKESYQVPARRAGGRGRRNPIWLQDLQPWDLHWCAGCAAGVKPAAANPAAGSRVRRRAP